MATLAKSNIELDLTIEERTVVNAAHEALVALKKTFEHWTMIGRGLIAIRNKADRMGGRRTFDRLREQAGLGPQHLDKSIVSRLFRVMDQLPEVEAWRRTLTEKERFEWASPGAVLKHCPIFKQPKSDAAAKLAPSPIAKLKTQVTEQQHEIEHLKEQLSAADGGNLLTPKDTAAEIAAVLMDMLAHDKVEALIRELKRQLPVSIPPTPKKAGARRARAR
jgi:hypothetical protein